MERDNICTVGRPRVPRLGPLFALVHHLVRVLDVGLNIVPEHLGLVGVANDVLVPGLVVKQPLPEVAPLGWLGRGGGCVRVRGLDDAREFAEQDHAEDVGLVELVPVGLLYSCDGILLGCKLDESKPGKTKAVSSATSQTVHDFQREGRLRGMAYPLDSPLESSMGMKIPASGSSDISTSQHAVKKNTDPIIPAHAHLWQPT